MAQAARAFGGHTVGRASRAIVLVTGIQAAGKSTIAQLLAERLSRSVHVRGDLFRRMVVNGRADMTPEPASEALAQLRLRHQLTATVSDAYFQAGFTVIAQDVILGDNLAEMTAMIRNRPLLVVVLAPQPSVIAAREAARGKTAYDAWTIGQLDDVLRNHTPRLGLWLDTSTQTPAQTTDEIMDRAWTEASILGARQRADHHGEDLISGNVADLPRVKTAGRVVAKDHDPVRGNHGRRVEAGCAEHDGGGRVAGHRSHSLDHPTSRRGRPAPARLARAIVPRTVDDDDLASPQLADAGAAYQHALARIQRRPHAGTADRHDREVAPQHPRYHGQGG